MDDLGLLDFASKPGYVVAPNVRDVDGTPKPVALKDEEVSLRQRRMESRWRPEQTPDPPPPVAATTSTVEDTFPGLQFLSEHLVTVPSNAEAWATLRL